MPASLLTVTPLTASGISHVFDNVPYGVFAWYDATRISGVTSNTSLSIWTDRSATGSHVSNSLVTQQPLFKNAVIGANPAVRYVTTAALSNSMPFGAAPFTVAMVSVSSSTAAAVRTIAGSDTHRWGTTGEPCRYTTVAVKDYDTGNGFWVQGTAQAQMIVYDSGFTATFYKDGSLNTAIGGASDSGAGTIFVIGGSGVIPNNGWAGDIGEIIIWKAALPPSSITQVFSYLSNKWGTP